MLFLFLFQLAMDKEILVELSQPTTVGPLQPQKPDRSITKPGTLVTPESDHHEYKSLQQLNQKQNTEIKFVSKISKKIHEDWKKGFNAMLNSKYGTVHFGIADDCLVEEGIPLTEKDKDEIHVRVSQSFETFFPSVIEHSTFGIDFIKMENGLFRFDVYIERKSSPYTVFMSRDNSIAYWRSGGRCARIPVDAIQDRSGTQIRKTLEDPDQHGKSLIDLLSPFLECLAMFVELLDVISSQVRHGLSEEAIKKETDTII